MKYSNVIKVIGSVFAGMIIYSAITQDKIRTKKYNICCKKLPKDFDGFKIVQLSDIHSKNFGKNNCILLSKIHNENPNVIFITGDSISRNKSSKEDTLDFINLCKTLCVYYKVYYIFGNHEVENPACDNEYISKLTECGVEILNNKSTTININNCEINLYGLMLDSIEYKKVRASQHKGDFVYNKNILENNFGKLDENKFNILITHNPTRFNAYSKFGYDLIFCGHMHAGMIRLPLIGGILSPEKTILPKYDYGKYKKEKINGISTMIVNGGLGNGTIPFRFLNRPEIVSVTLKAGN